MAVDSKLKRMSAVGSRRLPWFRRFTPSPDSSVDQADRQHTAYVYRGVLAGEPVIVVNEYLSLTGSIHRTASVTGSIHRTASVTGSIHRTASVESER